MKYKINLVSILSLSLFFHSIGQNPEQNFQDSPNSAKPWVFLFWMSWYFTKEGITKDLEMMADVVIGGVLIKEVQHHILPEDPMKYRLPFKSLKSMRVIKFIKMIDMAGGFMLFFCLIF